MKTEGTISVYWDILQHASWTLHLAATDVGLCYVTLPSGTFDSLQEWVTNHVPGATLRRNRDKLETYIQQLEEYFTAARTSFSLPLDLRGTPFQRRVWQALQTIEFGTTQSYSQIAATIGQPRAVRAVGAANGANPIPIVIPCHRVIGKNGTLTGYSGGLAIKEKLLKLEGMDGFT